MDDDEKVVGCDPVTVAWQARGGRLPEGEVAPGVCVRCAQPSRSLVEVNSVLSRGFTSIEQWRHPRGWGLCPPCAWSFTAVRLRQRPHLVTKDPTDLRELSLLELGYQLRRPVGPTEAITVPSRPGRKHVLPSAQWGRVTLDETPLTWTPADVTRLAALTRLRASGATSVALTRPTPPWSLIRAGLRAGVSSAETLTDWEILDPWRARSQWLTVAMLATPRP